jgi:peptidoglycan/LPS O-acetylase OafA/YrhL
MSYIYLGKEFNKSEAYQYGTARVARVVPLFLVVVLLSYALNKYGVTGVLYNIPDKKILFSHLALLSGESALWTISVEIQFYLIFIFLWWVLSKRKNQFFILVLILSVFIFFKFPLIQGDLYGIPYKLFLINSIHYFLMGLIFGQVYKKWKIPDNLMSRYYLLSLLMIPFIFPKIFIFLTGVTNRITDPSVIGILTP